MIGAAFGAFGQGLAAGFLAQRRMADVAGKGLMGLVQGGGGPKPLAPDAFAARAAPLNTLAPSVDIRQPVAAANAGMNDVVAQAPAAAPQPAGAPNAPSPQAAPAAPVAAAPAATSTPAAAEAAQAPVARGIPVPQSKPGDGLVWSDRGPGDRLMMVRRDALRPGEQSFAVTEGTIGAGRGLPSMEASTDAMAAPVTPVTVEELPPLQRGMGGPTSRPVVRGASGGQIAGAAGSDTLVGGSGATAPARSSGRFSPSQESASAYQWFVSNGYSPAAAAGIVGNLVNESGMRLDPRAVHDGGTGLGIAGWRDPKPGSGRRSALFSFARERGLDPYDRETQFRFLDHELRTSERGVGDRLRNAKDAREAASIFIDFERPAGWKRGDPTGAHGYQNRLDAALAHFGGQAEPGASAIASAGPVAEGEAPKDEGGAQAKEMAAQQQQAAQEQASSGGSGGGGALPAAPVGVTVPEISNPIVGGGEPVNMAGARTVASRGLPPAKPAQKSNTWAALRAALQKDAA